MFTGPSSSTRLSHQRAISSACRLVSEAANLQPTLPVQATRPARIEVALVERPSASIFACASATWSDGTPEISKFCQTVSRISPSPRLARDLGEAAHLGGRHLADRQHDAEPVQLRLLLRMHADMGGAVERRARHQRLRRDPVELAAELLLDQRHDLVHAHAVDDVFEPRLVAVGAVAVVDVDAHDGVRHLAGVGRPHHHAGLAREVRCPVMPPTIRRNHTPGSTPKPSFTSTAWKPMSLVSSSTGMMPPPSNATLNLRGRP